jgi:hypothetical protein
MTTPKIKVIPTPAQARILKALAINNGLHIIWPGKGMAEWTGTNWPTVKRETGKLMSSTVRKLSQEQWIEPDQEGSIFWLISDAGHEALERHGKIELVPHKEVTAYDLLKAISKQRHQDDVVILELAIHYPGTRAFIRFVDAFAITHTGITSWAYEIKVSRSDWLEELKQPRKREPAMLISNVFYFVAPVGVIHPKEVPEGCGLLVCDRGHLTVAVRAPLEHRNQPTWELVGEIAKKLSG